MPSLAELKKNRRDRKSKKKTNRILELDLPPDFPRRLINEYRQLTDETHIGISNPHFVDPRNKRYFCVTVDGPEGTPYESGVFLLEIFMPIEHPMSAFKVRFLTKILHPNIDTLGRICITILKASDWTPALNIVAVLESLRSLLSDPNPSDPLNTEFAEAWIMNEDSAKIRAAEYTQEYATQESANQMISRIQRSNIEISEEKEGEG